MDELAEHLEIPAHSTNLQRLAEEITKGAATDFEKARAVESHLKTYYRYSLDPLRGGGEDAVEDFLFNTRAGYCEHFASSMALLLRAAGIPARLAVGYLGAEYNGFGSYYIIRQSDAHSWVEAYMDGKWIPFDPTPAAGLSQAGRSGLIALYMDSLKWRWTRHIINYSLSEQIKLIRTANAGIDSLKSAVRIPELEWRRPFKILAAIIIAAGGVFMLLSLKRRENFYGKTPAFYLEMLRMLGKKGFTRKGFETPLEFARRVDLEEVMRLTEAFQRKRYGGLDASLDEVETLLFALRGRLP
jgi:hypothetical protein